MRTIGSNPAEATAGMDHVVGLYIDGNSVQIAEVERIPGSIPRYNLRSIYAHEEESLFEVVERLRHPIFMDSDRVAYRKQDLLREVILRIMEKCGVSTPRVVACLASESVKHFHALTLPKPAAVQNTIYGLLSQLQDRNPLSYPFLFTVRHVPGVTADGRDQYVLTSTMLTELIGFHELLKKLPMQLVGFTNPFKSLSAALDLFALGKPGEDGQEKATMLTDFGRLRTHYVATKGNRLVFCHRIPTGLARDDMYYFKSLPLRMEEVLALNESHGSLLLPVEQTPAPTFDVTKASPQQIVTRTAAQVSHYLRKAIEYGARLSPDAPIERHILTGLPSRLPGLRKYLQNRTGLHLLRPERLELPKLEFLRDRDHSRIADFLIPVGAALPPLGGERVNSNLQLVRRPVVVGPQIAVSSIVPGQVYQVTGPFQLVK